MKHPHRAYSIAILIAIALATCIDITWLRIVIVLPDIALCLAIWYWHDRTPRSTARRWEMTAYHIDSAMQMAQSNEEKELLLAWCALKLKKVN